MLFFLVRDKTVVEVLTIGKSKVVPVHAMKAYRGSRGIALGILNLSARWS
jgi:hypothetical protein